MGLNNLHMVNHSETLSIIFSWPFKIIFLELQSKQSCSSYKNVCIICYHQIEKVLISKLPIQCKKNISPAEKNHERKKEPQLCWQPTNLSLSCVRKEKTHIFIWSTMNFIPQPQRYSHFSDIYILRLCYLDLKNHRHMFEGSPQRRNLLCITQVVSQEIPCINETTFVSGSLLFWLSHFTNRLGRPFKQDGRLWQIQRRGTRTNCQNRFSSMKKKVDSPAWARDSIWWVMIE